MVESAIEVRSDPNFVSDPNLMYINVTFVLFD